MEGQGRRRRGQGGEGGRNEKGAQCADFADTARTMGGLGTDEAVLEVAFLLLSLAILFYSRSGSPSPRVGYQHFILEAAVFEMAFLLLNRSI